MTPHDDLISVARRVEWYREPAAALADPDHFLAHVMTYGTIEDVTAARRHFSEEDFRHALDCAPAGVMDPRSWSYWHAVFGRIPPPPMPRRVL